MMDAPPPPPPGPMPPRPPPPRGPSAALILGLGCGAFVILALVGILVLAALGSGEESIADTAILTMDLSGDVPEYVPDTGLAQLLGAPVPLTVRDHLLNLEKAAADKRIKGVVVQLAPLAIGWAKVEELRDGLLEFKKSGKFVVAYGEFLGEKEYALALAADEIAMPPDSSFEFNGLATDIVHFPGLLEKLGITTQFFRYGKYKSASGEQEGRTEFSAPVKEMLNHNLELTFRHLVDAVATHRKLDRDAVAKLVDDFHLSAEWALENKLIDTLAYQDQLEASLRKRMGLTDPDKKLPVTSASRYRSVSPSAAGLSQGDDVVALIYSVGLIVSGDGGAGIQGSRPLIKAIRRAVKDKRVKAILLRVDSPGGAGLGCDYVRREVELASEKKPVIVSMSDVAASGGYWVSMDATAIVAQPSTATGSVGIYAVIRSLGGLYEKLELNNETFKVGPHADALIGARPLTDEEAKRFDEELFGSYTRFVELAAKGRSLPVERMEELAQGRTWLGSEAKENGLVDAVGGFPAAIALAKEKAGLEGRVRLESFDRPRSVFEMFTDTEDDTIDPLDAVIASLVARTPLVGPVVKRVPALTGMVKAALDGHRTFVVPELLVDYR